MFTWTAEHTVEMAVSQYEVLSSTSGFEPHYNVSDLIVAARESAQEVDAKRAAVFVRLHYDGVRPIGALASHPFHLLQQEVYCHDFILSTACGSRPHTGDALQVLPVTHKTHTPVHKYEKALENVMICLSSHDTSCFLVQNTDAGTVHSLSFLIGFTSYRSNMLTPKHPVSGVKPHLLLEFLNF